MGFEIDDLPEGVTVHPAARALFGDDTKLLCVLDLGPLNSDSGSDAFSEFLEWREENPSASLGGAMRWVLESFEAEYDASFVSDRVIKEQLAREDEGDLDFDYDVYTLDETILTTALAQLITEGGIDDDARPTLAIALARQQHPLVLERIFEQEGSRDVRRRAVKEVERLIQAAGAPPKKA